MTIDWRDYEGHNTWCRMNQAMKEEYHKRTLCQCMCHIKVAAASLIEEGAVAFEDLPEETRTPRELLSEEMPCLGGTRHTFGPFETYCLCGALERGQANTLAEVFSLWPVAEVRSA